MPVDGSLNVPGLMADVTNTVVSQATGDDQPRPSTSTLHATLCLVDQLVGSVPSLRMPAPWGPRNWGHSSAGAENTRAAEGAEIPAIKPRVISAASWRIA